MVTGEQEQPRSFVSVTVNQNEISVIDNGNW